MSYEFTVIASHMCLPKQKQEATLARLNEAISYHCWMQGEADRYLFEYRKHKGNAPLSFTDMVELWGWNPTFDQTGDLVALTSYREETEDEQIERQFLEALAPDLVDESFVEVEIAHMRRRYVSFQGKIYQIDATYVYPALHEVIAQAKVLHLSQGEPFSEKQSMLTRSEEKAHVKLYACSVLAYKRRPAQLDGTQELKNFALSCAYPAASPREQIREEVSGDVRARQKLDRDWQIEVALCEIPVEVIGAVSESTKRRPLDE